MNSLAAKAENMRPDKPYTGSGRPGHRECFRRTFDYTSEGAPIMGVAVAPDGTLCGGTSFPMRFQLQSPKGHVDKRGQLRPMEYCRAAR